jgi:hypothetical protein
MSLKLLLARETAEMDSFTLIGDFEFSSILVKNHAANWISKRHSLFLSLTKLFYFLSFMVNGEENKESLNLWQKLVSEAKLRSLML